MKVVYPAWSTDKYNWDRQAAVLKPLSEVCDLTVLYSGNPPPAAEWCTLKQVAPPTNLASLYDIAKDAIKIAADLGDFDVLYCWSGGAHLQVLCALIAELAKRPCVMHINGDAHLSRKHHLKPMDRFMQDSIDRLSLNDVTLIVPISSVLKQAVEGRVKHIRVSEPVPFCVDTELYTPQPFPAEISVGYAGRISPEKGFPFFTRVMEAAPSCKFRLSGVIQMPIEFPDNTHYVGCLPLSHMGRFYAQNSVVALPSYGEGIPGVVLEAYACGRPVICTPEALPPELKCFGWTVLHDVDAWAKILGGLTQTDIQAKGNLARRWLIDNWPSWQDFAVTMNKKFQEVVTK